MSGKTWEQKLGYVMMAWISFAALVIVLHWWQDALGDDAAWVWLCHSMGNRECGPNEPWIKIQIGGAD